MAGNKLRHIAIIMDGNRRFAKSQGLSPLEGHNRGAANIKRIAEKCIAEEIQFLTIWGLSTDNVKERSRQEIAHIFSIAKKAVKHFDWLKDNNVKVRIIGDQAGLPVALRQVFEKALKETAQNSGLNLILAFNYGGRDELIRAIKKIVSDKIDIKEVSEVLIEKYLDTANIPEPDLIIRTGGARRTSGFLAWQSVYSELYFSDIYWPAFDEKELDRAISYFYETNRNRGK